MLSVVKMLLKGEVGGHVLNSHGNYIVDHGKSWNCVFEFLWEPCLTTCTKYDTFANFRFQLQQQNITNKGILGKMLTYSTTILFLVL